MLARWQRALAVTGGCLLLGSVFGATSLLHTAYAQPIPPADAAVIVANQSIYLPLVRVASAPCNDVEENDTPANAHELTSVGRSCVGSLESDPQGEDDYYALVLVQPGELSIELSQIPVGANYTLQVLNEQLVQVAASSNPGQASEQVVVPLPAGRYLVRVFMAQKATIAENSYLLTVTVR
jgi:hypothetical protein